MERRMKKVETVRKVNKSEGRMLSQRTIKRGSHICQVHEVVVASEI
jgi:hypothetical protein